MIFSHFFKIVLSIVLTAFCFATALGKERSPVGYWKVLDERTNQPTCIVQIENRQGYLNGKIVRLFSDNQAVCTQCSGDLHNKPLLGMTVLWNFKTKEEGFTEGKILAIKRGTVFNAQLILSPQNQTLSVLVQTPFGVHPQIWQRIQKEEVDF